VYVTLCVCVYVCVCVCVCACLCVCVVERRTTRQLFADYKYGIDYHDGVLLVALCIMESLIFKVVVDALVFHVIYISCL